MIFSVGLQRQADEAVAAAEQRRVDHAAGAEGRVEAAVGVKPLQGEVGAVEAGDRPGGDDLAVGLPDGAHQVDVGFGRQVGLGRAAVAEGGVERAGAQQAPILQLLQPQTRGRSKAGPPAGSPEQIERPAPPAALDHDRCPTSHPARPDANHEDISIQRKASWRVGCGEKAAAPGWPKGVPAPVSASAAPSRRRGTAGSSSSDRGPPGRGPKRSRTSPAIPRIRRPWQKPGRTRRRTATRMKLYRPLWAARSSAPPAKPGAASTRPFAAAGPAGRAASPGQAGGQ
jgi:hypothetical protein